MLNISPQSGCDRMCRSLPNAVPVPAIKGRRTGGKRRMISEAQPHVSPPQVLKFPSVLSILALDAVGRQ